MTCENCTQLRAELAQAKEKNLFLQTQVWDLDALCADLKAALAAERAARERVEARVREDEVFISVLIRGCREKGRCTVCHFPEAGHYAGCAVLLAEAIFAARAALKPEPESR